MAISVKLSLAALLLASCASVASAADVVVAEPVAEQAVVENTSGFYLGSFNGVTFFDNTDFNYQSRVGTPRNIPISQDYETGYYTAARLGYNFGAYSYVMPRIELEVGFGNSSVDHQINGGPVVADIDSFGDARTIQGYLNGYLDIPVMVGQTGFFSALTPYVGGGIGAMNLELRRQGVSSQGVVMDDDDTRFAYHLDAGVGISLDKTGVFPASTLFENTTLDVGYRYTAADDFRLTSRDGTVSKTDFESHAVMFGLRKQF
ncbi:porin family protein [Rhizobium sp. CFBP 8762]|uniref:outer membrane protein n=1 Tax=Rhizobium sp. CFBP 8762 TaxID=2775279 RepID=UPI00177AF12D|nr:porin family protein [Rhizobium sp. CFBP 8762]MBD8553560.1 porin family protein [Rhizobium sp. CFBP 8762]